VNGRDLETVVVSTTTGPGIPVGPAVTRNTRMGDSRVHPRSSHGLSAERPTVAKWF
jgi:hypothetical protein